MIKFPFTSFQQFNLDWIMQQLKKILDFMPLNGVPGDVLQRNVDGAAWMPISAISMDIHGLNTIPDVDPADELPIYDNDHQGNYKVSVSDLMDTAPVQSVNGQTGDVVITAAVDSVNGQTGAVVLDASDVGALPDTYSAPVDSVNGQTGTVVLDASDVGALPDTYAAPVDSVNGQTGTVVLDASDVGALPDTYVAPVTSVNGQTGDVVVGGGGSSPTLLWSNSSPAANFSARTISIDLSGYSFILVEYASVYMEMRTTIFHVPDISVVGYTTYDQLIAIHMSGSDHKLCYRNIQITTSSVSVGTGWRVDTYAGSSTSDDSSCRPTRIWGIE